MNRKAAILLAVLMLFGCSGPARVAPKAVAGVLDLRDWNFERDGPVSIGGDWDFYWKQLLGPDEAGSQALKVEGIWDDVAGPGGRRLGAVGYGTYRLQVLLPHARDRPELAVRLRTVMSAHRLWLDGQEVPGGGVVDADLARAVSASPNQFHVIPQGDDRLWINLQVANPEFRMGGIRRPVQIGTVRDVFNIHTSQILFDAVIFTSLLGASTYFLLMFAARPHGKETYRLHFGLFCLVMGLRATIAGDAVLIDIVWPGMSWHLQIVLEYAANFLGCALIPSMVASLYREQTPGIWLRCLQVLGLAMVAVVIVAPVPVIVKTGHVFDFLAVNAALLMIATLIRAIRAGREDAMLFLITIFIFAFGMLLDVLRSEQVLHSTIEVAPAAFAAVILVQTVILARSFTRAYAANEKLSGDLSVANDDLKLTNRAVQRFVPFEFLALLKRASIREVARGDSTAMEMEVLFCDLRDFTTIVEKLPASEAFAFINDWLVHMEPAIHEHQGFINQYLGDCIMALFEGGADQAVRAGLAMLSALGDFNAQQTHVPGTEIRIGIGLNTGPIMLGTIGGQDRLDAGIVGDAVNVAARVESMTKLYGTPFLITHFTRARLADPAIYALRELDLVAAKGKVTPVRIYEVLDGLPAAARSARLETRRRFSAGIEAYRRGDFSESKSHFEDCLAADPGDGPARLYVQRCLALLAKPPVKWEGVSMLTEK